MGFMAPIVTCYMKTYSMPEMEKMAIDHGSCKIITSAR